MNQETTTEKKDCGCTTTITKKYGLNILDQNSPIPNYRMTTQTFCKKHTEEREQQEKIREEQDKKYFFENLEEVKCKFCNETIGYMQARDIEGTRFMCHNCRKEMM